MKTKRIKKLKRGDTVVVISGKEKGKIGKILNLIHETQQVVVEGVNLRKKFIRAKEGKSVPSTVEYPIHVSNVMFLDPKEKKGTRIGFTFDEKGRKIRVAKKSGTHLT